MVVGIIQNFFVLVLFIFFHSVLLEERDVFGGVGMITSENFTINSTTPIIPDDSSSTSETKFFSTFWGVFLIVLWSICGSGCLISLGIGIVLLVLLIGAIMGVSCASSLLMSIMTFIAQLICGVCFCIDDKDGTKNRPIPINTEHDGENTFTFPEEEDDLILIEANRIGEEIEKRKSDPEFKNTENRLTNTHIDLFCDECLSHKHVPRWKKNGWMIKYIGHAGLATGSVTELDLKNNLPFEYDSSLTKMRYEGFMPSVALYTSFRALLGILFKNDFRSEDWFNKMTIELSIIKSMFKMLRMSDCWLFLKKDVNDDVDSILEMVKSNASYKSLIGAADYAMDVFEKLSRGSSFSIFTGTHNHAIYADIQRGENGGMIVVIQNGGYGLMNPLTGDFRHHRIRKPAGESAKVFDWKGESSELRARLGQEHMNYLYYPCVASIVEDSKMKDYLILLLASPNIKLGDDTEEDDFSSLISFSLIYDEVYNGKKLGAFLRKMETKEPEYESWRPQLTGNCAVYNYYLGLYQRVRENDFLKFKEELGELLLSDRTVFIKNQDLGIRCARGEHLAEIRQSSIGDESHNSGSSSPPITIFVDDSSTSHRVRLFEL